MKDSKIPLMPNFTLIAKLLSGGALWRADSRHAPAPAVKRLDSWLSISLSRMSRARLR
jgi:hypothetical protein